MRPPFMSTAPLLLVAAGWLAGCSQAKSEGTVTPARIPVVYSLTPGDCEGESITILADQIVEADLGRAPDYVPIGSQTERLVRAAGGNALFKDQSYPVVRGYFAARITCPE